jgi:hypothetical protein
VSKMLMQLSRLADHWRIFAEQGFATAPSFPFGTIVPVLLHDLSDCSHYSGILVPA